MTPRRPPPPTRPEVVTRERAPSRARRGSSARPAPTTRRSALLYIATALIFLALAATEFALMRVQLIVPENDADPARDLQPVLMTVAASRSSSSSACR